MDATEPTLLTAETEELHVGYEVRGPADGTPILLLHGWPDSLRTWDTVAATLAAAGYRTVVPSLRGFGPTWFRHEFTPRTGQIVAMARDAVQLLDALRITRLPVVGHDWGGRIGYALAALWPERVERLVALSVGYETGIPPGSTLDYVQQRGIWYQWFFGSDRGREALRDNRRELCWNLWKMWSPTWQFGDDEFESASEAWANPDWLEITLHSYRVRWGNAPTDPRFAEWEERIKQRPRIAVPTVLLHGGADDCSLPKSTEGQEESFTAGYRREVLPGIGHFIPRERPDAVSRAVLG